jgi:curli biogenesis system outer membrane secretion channel CsgG
MTTRSRFGVISLTAAAAAGLCLIFAGPSDAAAQGNRQQPRNDQNINTKLPPYTGPKKRLAVMDLELKVSTTESTEPTSSGGVVSTTSVSVPIPTEFGTGMTEMLTTALINSNRFVLIERKALDDIKAEQEFGASEAADATAATTAGKMLGAQVLIRGAITEYTYRRSSVGGGGILGDKLGVSTTKAEALVGIDIRMYDAATGIILDSVHAQGKVSASAAAMDVKLKDVQFGGNAFAQSPLGQATRQAIDKAVALIAKRMESIPWEARIAQIDPEEATTIYINAGSSMGVKAGDVLEILKPGVPIIDPQTRVAIGRTKDKPLGRCKVDSVTPALAIATVDAGEGFEVGDVVRFPSR